MIKLAVAVPELPSATLSTTVLLPSAALQPAATFAEIVPPELLMEVTEMPVGTVIAVTTKLPAEVSPSLTVAMVETDPAVPRCRINVEAAVIVGRLLLTVSVNGAFVVEPQLSVAWIVIVCAPTGAALLMDTTPEALTEIVPV